MDQERSLSVESCSLRFSCVKLRHKDTASLINPHLIRTLSLNLADFY